MELFRPNQKIADPETGIMSDEERNVAPEHRGYYQRRAKHGEGEFITATEQANEPANEAQPADQAPPAEKKARK